MDTRGFNEKDIMSSLDGIAEAISAGGGGGSSLPEVNSDDNGKVLTVVNGAWDKGDVPTELPAVTSDDNGKILKVTEGVWNKGNIPFEKFIVTFSGNNSDGYTIDKSLREIITAYDTGKKVVFKFGSQFTENENYVGCEFTLTGVKDTNGEYDVVSVYSVMSAGDNLYSVGITVEGSSEDDPYIWIIFNQIG